MNIPELATYKSPLSDKVFYYTEGNKVLRWSSTYPCWDFCGYVSENGFFSKLMKL